MEVAQRWTGIMVVEKVENVEPHPTTPFLIDDKINLKEGETLL